MAAALAARLTAYPHVRLAFDAEVVQVEQDAAGVAVRVHSARGERIERGAYLLAADGMGSAVRACLGIGLEGVASVRRLLQVLTPADLRDVVPGAGAATWVHAPGGWCGLLRMPDLWQIAVPLPDDESDETALEERALRARLARFVPFGATVLPLVGREVQPVRRQVAGTYAAGRVLLAGDAAHQAQTRSGLNMNCGLHDAMAAAEALATALNDPDAAGAALDRYAQARRRVAVGQLLPYADRAVPGDEAWAAGLAEAAAGEGRAQAWLRTACMLDMPGFRTQVLGPGLPA